MFYVYEWYIIETGEVVYVGKGCKNRYKVRNHNRFFNDIITRFDCSSRIIRCFDSEEDAFAFEYDRINEMQKIGQCKCNIRNGGFGGETKSWTAEKREQYSKNNVMHSKNQRERMSKNNPMKNPEVAYRVNQKNKRKVIINGDLYNSVKEAASELNVSSYTISNWCKRGYDINGNPCRYHDEPQKQYPESKKLHPRAGLVRAVIIDGVRYCAVCDAAKALGVCSKTIIRAIKNNRPFKGHECRYDNQQPSCGKSDNSTTEGPTTNE